MTFTNPYQHLHHLHHSNYPHHLHLCIISDPVFVFTSQKKQRCRHPLRHTILMSIIPKSLFPASLVDSLPLILFKNSTITYSMAWIWLELTTAAGLSVSLFFESVPYFDKNKQTNITCSRFIQKVTVSCSAF